MKTYILKTLALAVIGTCGIAANATAAEYVASTDYTGYTGSVSTYATLADAQSGSNAVNTYAIPDRVTAAPSDTPYRDVAFYMVSDHPSFDSNQTDLLTAWYYTTNPDHGAFSGYDNPNNTNTGFLQLYDTDSSTVTSGSGVFSNLVGGVYTDYHLQVSGVNAINDTNDPSNDHTRLWPAPTVGGAASISAGEFHSYDLDVTFGGLDGQLVSPGIYESDLDPSSVSGTFKAVFENTSTTNPGFYSVDFTFGMDNWAVAQGNAALNGALSGSTFIGTAVPEPTTFALAGLGLASLATLRRRRKA